MIKVHDNVLPDEVVKYQIFDLATNMIKYSKVQNALHKQALEANATIIMYDHRYRDVRGILNLDLT